MPAEDHLKQLLARLAPYRQRLLEHPVYRRLGTLAHLRVFCEHHVFAVWDFMSLLKFLQRELTCAELPWTPRGPAELRRLINEIVVGEECDDDPERPGDYVSHFELYLRAMRKIGASTASVEEFVERLSAGQAVREALASAGAPVAARAFVESTWKTLATAQPHRVAAAFALGREDLIPGMFRALIADLQRKMPDHVSTFQAYLERHIGLDEDHHGPLALRMVVHLCGDDAGRWEEAAESALAAFEARERLWSHVAELLDEDPAYEAAGA